MVEAYGFTTRQALCDQLGVTKGTMANRYMRDSFPSDWVIQCALETGASLRWLTTGSGVIFENLRTDIIELTKKKIIEGKLFDAGFYFFDKAFLPLNMQNPLIVIDKNRSYICDSHFSNIHDGNWLIKIDDNISIKRITNIPGNNVAVSDEITNFTCDKDLIVFIAKTTAIILQE